MIILPTLRQLQYLSAVAKYLNFRRAAEECLVTQSTLSAGIKELEIALGTVLLERTKRRVMLTPVGEDIVKRGEDLLHRAEEIAHIAKASTQPLTGRLRLGVIPTIAPFMLPGLLDGLADDYPELKLHIHEDLTHNLIRKMMDGILDVAILAFPWHAPELDHMIFTEDPFYLCAPNNGTLDHVSLDGDGHVKVQDILRSELRIMLLEDGHCLRDHAQNACSIQTGDKQFAATSLHTLVSMVHQGLGATLLPEMAYAHGITNGMNVVNYALEDKAPARQIGLAWRMQSPRLKEFTLFGNYLKNKSDQLL